jgi:hypothetical protein
MYIVDMAIDPVVCQKSNFHGNIYSQNSQRLDPLQIVPEKNFRPKMLAFQTYFVARG